MTVLARLVEDQPATAACHYCGAAGDLIQPFAFGTPVARVICRDGDACVARMDAGTLPQRPQPVHPPHPEPLADAVVWQPGREPVSGRSEPRPAPLPAHFRHDVRWDADEQGIYARCKPCDDLAGVESRHHIDRGHRTAAFVRFDREHSS